MSTKVLSGKDLRKIGYPEGRVIGVIMATMDRYFKNKSRSFKLELLQEVFDHPEKFEKDEVLGKVVYELRNKVVKKEMIELNPTRLDYKIYGAQQIEEGARNQMEIAMKLPVTLAGALMPDAHQGYGLPIGGVLATKNAVIPYGVGVDIGCRMCLSVFPLPPQYLEKNRAGLKKILTDHTKFGYEVFKKPVDDPIFEREEFQTIKTVRDLKDRAYAQIGSSGGGNHFVEFGTLEITDEKNEWDLAAGSYVALLSHSGSRGLGAEIARHYTKLAMDQCKLPGEAKHLAWLDLDTEEGQEYWLAMNLAGDYASACHHHIHRRISKALGEKNVAMIENHHNFAWKEKLADGTEVIVHRKGATPAGKGVPGIIPGSMTTPGFLVRGKGNADALNSAAHGAGRMMSRSKAKQTITRKDIREALDKAGVELIGGDTDEAPMAYKDIRKVMDYQNELVEVAGIFMPKIVRMA